MMKKGFALLCAFTVCFGCAGQAPPSSRPPSGAASAPRGPLAEEFDPNTLRETPLLIQPTFSPPLPETVPPPEEAAPPAAVPERQPTPHKVYRLQLMALSNGDVAEQRRDELERQLGVPVRVDPASNLFLVRAGAFSTAAEAERLKTRATALSDEYADAYVVVGEETAEPVAPSEETAAAATPDTALTALHPEQLPPSSPPPPRLVPAFGWRVRLDKIDSYQQAQQFKQNAMQRLKRTDIDVTFTTPYYNVEVGYYRTEVEAQEALERLRRRYPNALKVRGQILVPAEEE